MPDGTLANTCQAPSPDTPEGVVVCTPVTPGMNLAWNPSLPWLRFARLLQPEMGSGTLPDAICCWIYPNTTSQIHLSRHFRSQYPQSKSSMLPLKSLLRSPYNAWFQLCRGVNSASPQTYIVALVQPQL